MNRVYCLYRVSTSQQLHEDDIPMQRQASGESLKTSERIKTRMAQLTADGIFCGGSCPYGYQLIMSGRKNNRGYHVHDLGVEPNEAAVICKIYDYHIRYGYGSRKIASELASSGIFNRQGEPFHPSSIKAILQREQLTGIMCRGNTCSDIIPELQIISPEVFRKAQQITEKRKQHQIPRTVTGQNLLSGNIFCGYCGGRIFASTARKSHHPTIEGNTRISIYKCYNRVQHRKRCTGQTTYRAAKIEQIVLNQLEEHVEANCELQKLHT